MTEADKLKGQILEKIGELRDSYFTPQDFPPLQKNLNLTRTLQGHFQKVYAVDWAGKGSNRLLSASQDGKLIVWNANTENKTNAVSLKCVWVMCCAFEKNNNKLVASGGLSNICSIHKINDEQIGITENSEYELEGHAGYISSCVFVNERTVATSSGDGECRVWDLSKSECTHFFDEHEQDVMGLDKCPSNENLFISGSCDKKCKLWDIRIKSSAATFRKDDLQEKQFMFAFNDEINNGDPVATKMYLSGHEGDINSVRFFSNGNCFASGSDDASCRLWDLRSQQQINVFQNPTVLCGVTSVDFSLSGRVLFSGYDDQSLLAWDSLDVKPESAVESNTEPIMSIRSHASKVSHVRVHSAGKAVATASWDTLVKVFA